MVHVIIAGVRNFRIFMVYTIKSLINGWMDGWVRVLCPFNSISVISRRWKGEHERLCATKRRLGSGRISSPAGFEPATPWSEVGSANRSATRMLLIKGEWKILILLNQYWSIVSFRICCLINARSFIRIFRVPHSTDYHRRLAHCFAQKLVEYV